MIGCSEDPEEFGGRVEARRVDMGAARARI